MSMSFDNSGTGKDRTGSPVAPEGGGLSREALDRLAHLEELHEQGILTDAEFEVQKQKLLQAP